MNFIASPWRFLDKVSVESEPYGDNALQLDLHGMSIEESIEKLENHIARLTGLSSATFVIEVSKTTLVTTWICRSLQS